MKKIKKKNIVITLAILALVFICRAAAGGVFALLTPTVKIDFSSQSELTGRASGFLYGFAEEDIPTAEIAESIGINALATKTAGGLQHPVGDVRNVSGTFLSAGGEMLMVYTQDMYDTWYYQLDSLEEYNEKVRVTVTEMENSEYRDNLVYCIYNEMDNGAWLGNFWEEENRYKFYNAWKDTFSLVKGINPEAKIAGPGHCGYNYDFIKEFLNYCKENSCLPEVVVWHELSDQSVYWMEHNFNGYYSICDELGIERLPVCISEYGLMRTNGIPGESVKWISRLEEQDAYGCVAYWRLANNLSDTVADDVTPNSNYWVYKFYASMKGKELKTEEWDMLHSNIGNYLKGKYPLMNKGFIALASFDENEEKFYIMTSGGKSDSKVKIENLKDSGFNNGDKVSVKISSVSFKGLGGEVLSPTEESVKEIKVKGNAITFEVPCESEDQAFFIEITKGESESFTRLPYSFRLEAEDMEMSGTVYASNEFAYSTSGGTAVKDFTRDSSLSFSVNPFKDGTYTLELVYGNGNTENGRLTGEIAVTVNGTVYNIMCPPTLKADCMECVRTEIEIEKGKNKIIINNISDVPLTLDFIDFTPKEEKEIFCEKLTSRNTDESENAYSLIIPEDGFYKLSNLTDDSSVTVNGTEYHGDGDGIFYFGRGYNKVVLKDGETFSGAEKTDKENMYIFTPDDVKLIGGAEVSEDSFTSSGKHIGWISSEKGSNIEFTVNAESEGLYAFTVEYANNEEGGYHDYNVDLIERYITVSVNGIKKGNYFFRSTYSWDNYKTKTVVLYLNKGENKIVFANDGSYTFNNSETFAPDIGSITVNYAQ